MTGTDQGTAVDKALDVLFHVHEEREPQGVSDIGRALSIPKSTAHRMLSALRRRRLVDQDEAGRYRPGLGVLALAAGLLDSEPIVAAARGVLAEEAEVFGETFFLVAARDGRLLVLEKAEGTGVLRVSPEVGSQVPVHGTAVGKLYLAHGSNLVNPSQPKPFTGSTIVDPGELAMQVAAVREQGYAVNDEEWIEGLGVVAAPIFASNGIAGAVCTAMAAARLRGLELEEVVGRVTEAATRIEARIGGLSV